jgi:hypothetical protein
MQEHCCLLCVSKYLVRYTKASSDTKIIIIKMMTQDLLILYT